MAGYKIHNSTQPHFITFSVVDWIDAFTRPVYKQVIVDSLLFCRDEKGLQIHGWCLMTNHIHLVVSCRSEYDLSSTLRDFKRHTARQILDDLAESKKESRKGWMLWMFKQAGKVKSDFKNVSHQFWQHGLRPMEIYSNSFFTQKMEYMHYNPVKKGFCYRPEDYPYSSARWYKEKKGLIEMDEILI